jgi:hypothetical protein
MRWTAVDAGTRERLNDVIEDARGRWWIAGDVVRVSDDRGATWRVALEQWTRALAVDGDTIWAGGSELHCRRDGGEWQHHGERFGDTVSGLLRCGEWLYRSQTFENTKADIWRGWLSRSRDGDAWTTLLSLDYATPTRIVGWPGELLLLDDAYAHRSIDDGATWSRESLPRQLSFWRSDGEALFAHDYESRRWRSADRGRSWEAGAIDAELTRLSSVSRLRDGSWLAVGGDGRVRHGVDDGTA